VVSGKATLDEFMAQLTDEQLIHLLGGQPNTTVANTYGMGNLPEYGVPTRVTVTRDDIVNKTAPKIVKVEGDNAA